MVPRVPILSRVTAGMPILAVEEHIGDVPFEPAAGGGEYYALRIRGDSMIGVGIMDDDLVIIRQDITGAQRRHRDRAVRRMRLPVRRSTLRRTVYGTPGKSGVPANNGTGSQIFGLGKGVYREV